MNNLFTHVLVINLDKDTGRWEQCQKELDKINLRPIRIPAIYGAKMSEEEYRKNTSAQCYSFCTPSMVGCWLSHKKSWQYIVDNNIESALILEDDCQFEDDFQKKLQEYTKEIPENWDIVLLGTILECKGDKCGLFAKLANIMRKNTTPVANADRFISEHVYRPNAFMGAHSYVVSNKGAKKLLSLLDKADGHVDLGISRHFPYVICYAITPSITYQTASTGQSTQTSSFPRLLNRLLDNFSEDNITLGFMLSEPIAQYKGYIINGWSVFFLILGVLMRVDKSRLLIALTILYLLAELALDRGEKTIKQVAGAVVSILLGYLLAGAFTFSK